MALMMENLRSLEPLKKTYELRDHMEEQVLQQIPDIEILGQDVERLPNTSSMVVSGVDGESLMMALDLRGVAVSTGAACSSGSPEPSPALLSMGLSREKAQSSLRISLCRQTTLSLIHISEPTRPY